MKTKFTLLMLLMLFTATFNYAQTSAEIADIAVQGIARDNNNTARTNATISLTFELYYLDANNGNTKVVIGNPETVNLTTDAFGVFSHIISPAASNNPIFANQQVYLKISEGSQIISEEKLKHVPYAIAANNGVPTGAIMPFVGTTAPTGWVLCDGRSLIGINGSQKLIDLLGSNNAPNLQAMYLRGAGSQAYGGTNYAGIALGVKQKDGFQSHDHTAGSLLAANAGEHTHDLRQPFRFFDVDHGSNYSGATTAFQSQSTAGTGTVNDGALAAGIHSHQITGLTGATGTLGETRPVSYGVNYIIKL